MSRDTSIYGNKTRNYPFILPTTAGTDWISLNRPTIPVPFYNPFRILLNIKPGGRELHFNSESNE